MDEGVAQLFVKEDTNRKIIGTVGALQFDVIQYRLEHEYGAKCQFEGLPMHKACWVSSDDEKAIDDDDNVLLDKGKENDDGDDKSQGKSWRKINDDDE